MKWNDHAYCFIFNFQLPDDPEFDTTIQGPWMKKWDIVHMNQHTSKLTEDVFSSWHGHKS